MHRLAVVIPAYNEAKSITNVVESLNKMDYGDNISIQVIVVNDCSTDNTATVISALNCVSLMLPSNLGIGGAVQTGYRYAFNNNFDWAVQVDGDGQHPAHELKKLIDTMLNENADVVIGSRFLKKEGFQSSLMRRVGINYFKTLIRFLCGITITDATSGFRLFNKKTLELVNDYYPDEYPEPESVVYFTLHHLKIVEIPVSMDRRKDGTSSIGRFASVYFMLKVTLAVLFTFLKFRFSPKTLKDGKCSTH
ncbi:MAG: glycosyltransferase family 2 protein [Bacteroidales bacterium]|nr:glycosyltransferase family 2 protein [Bacteroidales bacterium]